MLSLPCVCVCASTWCVSRLDRRLLLWQRLFKDLLPLMEEWSGTKLKSTACYGVRNYFRDSVLANHVDRVDTHVISGIINVEQVNFNIVFYSGGPSVAMMR